MDDATKATETILALDVLAEMLAKEGCPNSAKAVIDGIELIEVLFAKLTNLPETA